jgi:hypothetical protein
MAALARSGGTASAHIDRSSSSEDDGTLISETDDPSDPSSETASSVRGKDVMTGDVDATAVPSCAMSDDGDDLAGAYWGIMMEEDARELSVDCSDVLCSATVMLRNSQNRMRRVSITTTKNAYLMQIVWPN